MSDTMSKIRDMEEAERAKKNPTDSCENYRSIFEHQEKKEREDFRKEVFLAAINGLLANSGLNTPTSTLINCSNSIADQAVKGYYK